jgi:hypothetical protein
MIFTKFIGETSFLSKADSSGPYSFIPCKEKSTAFQGKIDLLYKKRGASLKENSKTWTFWVGVLLILAACVFAYITTQPAESNLSFINKPSHFARILTQNI